MSEQSIYGYLREGGLSPAGACAMMGNMFCESSLKSNIVEKRCSMGDTDYTYNVDNGMITRWQFMSDSYGYGLCQWTSSARKDALYCYAKAMGVSISDEQMQCEFCLSELGGDYADLYKDLCSTDNLEEATKRICAEYERPAVNNFEARINAAQRFFNTLYDEHDSLISECGEDACPVELPEAEQCSVTLRVLQKGALGRDVFLLQCGLHDMRLYTAQLDGDFGAKTEEAVKALQRKNCFDPSGIADGNVWGVILKAR